MTNSLTEGQKAVLRAFYDFGPLHDAALASFVHHHSDVNMASSGIRTRRAELVRKGLLHATGTRRLKSGRVAAVHSLTRLGQSEAYNLFAPLTRGAV